MHTPFFSGFSSLAKLFVLTSAVLAPLAHAESTLSYEAVAKLAKPAAGAPVEVKTNYFLAWTGAWDSVILREKELWKQWLPEGSTVEWKRNLIGPPVVTELLAGKQNIGYLGDNPAVASTTKRQIAELNVVAVNAASPGRLCGNLIVRADAPQFANPEDVLKWLEGKSIGAPKGSCAERLTQVVAKQSGVKFKFRALAPEVIITSLQAGKVDAAMIFEPYASKAVFDGAARYGLSAGYFGEQDANAVIMRRDFIDAHPEAAVAWLKADIQAMLFLRDHPIESIEIIKKELPEYTKENLWYALYGALPSETGAKQEALRGAFAFTPTVNELIGRVAGFLHENRLSRDAKLPEGAIQTQLIEQALTELGFDPNQELFTVKGSTANPFKGDELL